ncbi:globin domain-containing protein [Streptomyces pinistramenti]|uniref:globin domain-containing protein n=1 Tax=Streptomyces pinistramenti TaxID=2884812 RepID=UPI001D08F2EC|nr:globin domain-containing protein [Streptomyces pinistramenti]MCB5912237.1 globin domain-containing protein [Streptomyces pinistramenti]
MLSPKSADTVRATLPAVTAAIGDITPLFYDRLFAAQPALLRDLFNRANQANGTQRQALAGSIAAFAGHLLEHPDDRPDALLTRIAHKHASLGIREEQYPLVHTHLFAAIADVLGDAVTDEVAAAWDEVYWLMAHGLIAAERQLYTAAGAPDGRTWRTHRVTGRVRETDDVTTFLLRPLDGAPAPASRPGQYLSVQVELPDGARQIRQYSLTGQPDGALRFSVKRVPGGPDGDPAGEVSGFLHDHVHEGDHLRASAPFGDVVLDEGEGPLLFATAGIGCTPAIGMLTHLAATGSRRRIIAAHADRTPGSHPYRAELRRLIGTLAHAEAAVWYERPDGAGSPHDDSTEGPAVRSGLMDLTRLRIPAGTVAHLCGPVPFMRSVRAQLLASGVRAADIHHEVFGPGQGL